MKNDMAKGCDIKGTGEKHLVPALRFPEFKKAGEWAEMILGDVFERISEKNVNNNQNVLTISAQYGLVSQYDYFNKNVASTNIKNYYFIKKGDFAYNKSRSQGYPFGVIKPLHRYENGVVSTLYICFRIKKNCSINFYEQYFGTDLINNEISKIAQEGARNHGLLNISVDDFFNKISLLVPSPLEQQKIAECLSSIDEEISAMKEKVELLKTHKKGVMQKLFPIAGKLLPGLRFPEFSESASWDFVNGNNLFVPIVNKNHNSDLPILAITQDKGAVPRNLIDYKVIVSDNSIKNYKIVEIGDFIISLRSFQGGIEYSNYKGLCSPAYIVLRKISDNVYNDFYRHYLKSANYILELNRNIEGIRDGKMISYLQFSNIRLPFPSPEEQKKIAECLSSIDELISLYDGKVTLLEQHKKGLMQQLFPKL